MPGITDKFGKASISTDVAVATTVKTTRTAGVAVLEANDLSKYATDTPVFVVTYKKTTDPVTGAVSITNFRSWKALVNTGANTLTNLTIQPGYADDIGNAVGDFIECIPTTAWENSLIDGILAHANPDGSLKTSAVQAALNITGSAPPDWTVLANAPSLITPNGNRNYTFQFTGVDVTSFWSEGMKVRGVRASNTPQQAATTNGTTNYLTKTSPNKMIFTDNFTLGCVFRLPSYPTGANKYLFGRTDAGATGGWGVGVNVNGQLIIAGVNGGAGNFRIVNTYLRLALNRTYKVWATWASGTINIYIDGQLMPANGVTTGGTAPTTVQNIGDFSIGRFGANGAYIAAEISQVAVFDAVLSQATMRNYDTIGLSGSETNLKSAWSLNNVLTDLNTTTPNDLTNVNTVTFAAGGYFGNFGKFANIEFGQVVSPPVYSGGNTTFNVQAPQGCAFPQGASTLTSIYYSATDAPFGYPKNNIMVTEFIQQAQNWNSINPGNGNFKLDSSGACVGVYVPFDCDVTADIAVGVGATSDFEFRPEVWIDGSVPIPDSYYSPNAALTSAGGRAQVRGFTSKLRLTAGWHLISAGVELVAGGGYVMAIGSVNITVSVPIKVMV